MRNAALKTEKTFFRGHEGRWDIFLLFFSIAAQGYSIVVTGAKFWIDSIVYVQLALALFDADQLSKLYNSEFGFLYQHTQPGLPFLIRTLEAVFGERMWPALTVTQGLLSALAVTYFVLTFRDKLSRPAQLAAVFICGLHPYFVSFNNAALTESVSASILLISIGLAIRAVEGRLSLGVSLSLLLPLSILAAQFRPYLGLVGIISAVLVVFEQGRPRRFLLYAIIALALAVGTFTFPVYRAVLGLDFFLPNVDALMLTHVSYVTWDLDSEAAQSLNSVVLNDEIRARLIGKDPVSYADAKHMFDDLVAAGSSSGKARQTIAAAAWRLRTSSIGAIERQLQLPLASIGFQYAPVCCQPSRQLTRDLISSALFRQIRYYFRWNAGVDGSSYVDLFDSFTKTTRSSQTFTESAENFYIARIRPYVTDSLKPYRDPLHLTSLVSDPLIILGWFGIWLFFWSADRIALLIMAVPFATIYAVAVYTHIFGDNRHAHPLIPIVIIGVIKVADHFFTRDVWLRIRNKILAPSKGISQ
jgi:hypothetical protein